MELSKETEANIKILIDIRDDINTSPAVRIQAIQTMQKIMDAVAPTEISSRPTENDIMNKIRGKKK